METRTSMKLKELAETLRKLADRCEQKADGKIAEAMTISLCFLDGEVKGGMAITVDSTPLQMLQVATRQTECMQFLTLQAENSILAASTPAPASASAPVPATKPTPDPFDDLADDLANDPITVPPAPAPELELEPVEEIDPEERRREMKRERDRAYRERQKECQSKKSIPVRGRGRPPKLERLTCPRGRPPKTRQRDSDKLMARNRASAVRGKKKRR